MNCYIDFHTHTNLSDGAYSPQELIDMARKEGIKILSLTDHNYSEDLADLRKDNPDLKLIQGAEFSCLYKDSQGDEYELHVVGLDFLLENEKIQEVLRKNQPDRRPYINKILRKLEACGVTLGSYEELCEKYPETKHLGRKQLAMEMTEQGYTVDDNEAFDRYIGAYGERLAYVPKMLGYASLQETVEAILAGGGIPVLAHLFYYRLGEEENLLLLKYFKELAGEKAAMEVYYGAYSQEQWEQLKSYADTYGFMYSAGSDFHSGGLDNERLDNHFTMERCKELVKVLGI